LTVLFFAIIPLYLISVNISLQANNAAQQSIINFTQQNLNFLIDSAELRGHFHQVASESYYFEHGIVILAGSGRGIEVCNDTPHDFLENLQEIIRSNNAENGIWENRQYLAISKYSYVLDTTFVVYFLRNRFFGQAVSHINWLWVLTIYIIVLIVFIAFAIERMMVKPLHKLTNGFKKVAEGDFDIELRYGNRDEFGYAYENFNEVVVQHKKMIEQMYEQKIRAQSAELKQMQYQINPHFLYNSLYLIQRMNTSKNNEGIDRLSKHLGAFYRYITHGLMKEVTLQEEVEHAKDYLGVQIIHFRDRVDVTFDEIPAGFETFKVPKLIIQPLIENAYSHGMEKMVKGGILKITLKQDDGFLLIAVEDNGKNVNDETVETINNVLIGVDTKTQITGLLNVHRRIQIEFGKNSGMIVSRSELGGFRAELRIEV